MNFIRSILPGGKHRLNFEKKSLDISQITPRMYALSYPSDNFIESIYHNNQDDIAEYLNKNHPGKYLIFNLSGIPYENKGKFNTSVIDYFWPDHKAPPLYDIFKIIFEAYHYLTKDELKQNVICVHCLAGKGRTGTICCSLLLYGKLCDNAQDANNYFSLKRFKQLNKGVQEPSQLRYINYIERLINKRQNIKLKMYEIRDVFISGIKLKDGEVISYKFETNYYKEDKASYYLSLRQGQIVVGDVTINIYRNGKLIAWVFFNTHLEEINDKNTKLFYNIKGIDPRFLLKDNDYSLMTVEINIFQIIHNSSNNKSMYIDEMVNKEIVKIGEMNKYLNYAHAMDPLKFKYENTILFFGNEKNDIKDVLNGINK